MAIQKKRGQTVYGFDRRMPIGDVGISWERGILERVVQDRTRSPNGGMRFPTTEK
jgi:hypothetical protein